MSKLHVNLSKYFIYIVIPLHILLFISVPYLIKTNFYSVVGIILVYTLIGGFGLELGFHRMLSHSNFKLRYSSVENILIILGCFAMQGSPLAWTSLHRNHHIFVDTDKDFQSPKHGLWSSYIGWTAPATLQKKINIRLIREFLGSKMHLFLDKHYYAMNWLVHAVILFCSAEIYFGIFLPGVVLSFHVSSINNLIGHNQVLGTRPHKSEDWATDVWWAALFSWGISFQNTHHYDPNEINYAKHGGFDPGYFLYRILRFIGLIDKSNNEQHSA